jgi:hypothetical protein
LVGDDVFVRVLLFELFDVVEDHAEFALVEPIRAAHILRAARSLFKGLIPGRRST